jgi:hypothetical protein
MPPTENVERQIAIAVVIAVKEPPFLIAMYRGTVVRQFAAPVMLPI